MKKSWYNTSDPKIVDFVRVENKEFMFWLYCPIKTPMSDVVLPDNLEKWSPIVDSLLDKGGLDGKYVYLTVKSLYITPESLGQRAGWHSDGFLTEDVNYIWSDCNPTTFSTYSVLLTEDHEESLDELNVTYLDILEEYSYIGSRNAIYELSSNHIHKPTIPKEGMFRNFVKVSVSDHVYSHEGMSINHKLLLPKISKRVDYSSRNCPV